VNVGDVCRAEERADVLRVLNVIEEEQEWCFPPVVRHLDTIFKVNVGVVSCLKSYPLMIRLIGLLSAT
jgi:hypothetical protein